MGKGVLTLGPMAQGYITTSMNWVKVVPKLLNMPKILHPIV